MVVNKGLNETTGVVGDIKRHHRNTETHLLSSPPLQPQTRTLADYSNLNFPTCSFINLQYFPIVVFSNCSVISGSDVEVM